MPKENIIISLGGSLVAPGEIDTIFLKTFKKTISKYLEKRRFFVFVGGGKVCRVYQNALLEFGADNKERDWMGISISRLNAQIVRQSFDGLSFDKVITDPTKKVNSRRDVAVFGGYKPGWSTDYCAVLLAKNMGIKTIINLSNVDYVYDRDPSAPPSRKASAGEAKPIKEMSWKEFRKLVPQTWTPGLSAPFDPRASKMAEILKIKVVMVNGKHLDRLEDFLHAKPFIGTTIL